ncbi:alpha/beta hydrolase [Enterovirga sp.]|uniref:alpha/beta hydrolase n=1 Tax=Enterovirga sp. TaxID=2026350 RepID=UPI002627E178|nr:alpha/beta hydrolase [Enterovirga sp.]MDB5591463.1 alpha/beta hydrolase fold protein [Enterovirga sp.]
MTQDSGARADAEKAYNPRVTVPNVAEILAEWATRAAATRARLPLRTVSYGDHPREAVHLFRAPTPRGLVVFIHGGYWRALAKEDFSWLAESFQAEGLSVALIGYPLCPEVSLPRLREGVRTAFATLYGELLPAERERILVTGHSAGGYLAAFLLATNWRSLGLPEAPISGVLPISGVFALAPLLQTSINEAVRLDPASADALSLHQRRWGSRAALAFAVGGDETAAFQDQSRAMAENWADLSPTLLTVPGRHHFDVVDELARPESELHRMALRLLDGPG